MKRFFIYTLFISIIMGFNALQAGENKAEYQVIKGEIKYNPKIPILFLSNQNELQSPEKYIFAFPRDFAAKIRHADFFRNILKFPPWCDNL